MGKESEVGGPNNNRREDDEEVVDESFENTKKEPGGVE